MTPKHAGPKTSSSRPSRVSRAAVSGRKKAVRLFPLSLDGAAAVWKCRAAGLLIFVVQSAAALALVLPLYGKWNALLGHSGAGVDVLGGFGANFFFEFTTRHGDLISAETGLLAAFAAASLPAWIFFNGGLISCLSNGREPRIPVFLADCGRLFWRFALLFLLSIPLWTSALIVQSILGTGLQALAGGNESLRTLFFAVQLAFFAALAFGINMAFDYAKLITVRGPRRTVFRNAVRAFRFVLRNPRKTATLYFGIGCAGLILALLLWGASERAGFSSGPGLLVMFLLQQVLALSKIAVRMEFFAAQSALYRALAR